MIPLLQARVASQASEWVSRVLASGYINIGPQVAAFEAALAERLSAPEVLCTNSCTSALVLALRLALAPGAGWKRVAATPMTFVATTTAIFQVGALPQWVDIEQNSCQMSASIGGAPIDAVLAVAWAGWLPDLAALRAVADQHSVPLILDAAQAFGATFAGKPLHDWADYTCYSFSPTKHVTCSDGGALICRDPEKRGLARKLSWFGMRRHVEGNERVPSDQDIREWGYKFNMNEIAASIGLSNLESIGPALNRMRDIARYYKERLPFCWEMGLDVQPSPWFYTLFVDEPGRFIAHMAEHGVATGQPHRRNDDYFFAQAGVKPQLCNVDFAQEHYVALPVGWWMSDSDVERVVDAVMGYSGQLVLPKAPNEVDD